MSMSLHWIGGLFGSFLFYLSLFQLTIYISVCIYACLRWNNASVNEAHLDFDSDYNSDYDSDFDSDFDEIYLSTPEEKRKEIKPGARLRMIRR